MLLKTSDLLINESDMKESIIDSTPLNENFSFFSFGLNCMRESNQEIRSMMTNLYISSGYTNESVADDIMKDFSEKFSFKKIFDFIIDKFKEAIKKLVAKAKSYFLKLLAANSTIKKYSDRIENYNKDIKVDFDHYTYTYLDVDIPPSNLNTRFTEEYEDLLDDLKNLAKKSSKEELIHTLDVYYQETQRALGDNYYNQLRNEIVLNKNTNDPVTKERFIGRLWSFFRNNETGAYTDKIEIPPYEIKNALKRFSNGRDLVKEIENNKSKIEAACNKMTREINKISPLDFMTKGTYIPIDYDLEFAVDRILKLKCGQLTEMCNIFTTAFSCKLDAIKEALIQDKKVLFAVITDIMVSEAKGGESDE